MSTASSLVCLCVCVVVVIVVVVVVVVVEAAELYTKGQHDEKSAAISAATQFIML